MQSEQLMEMLDQKAHLRLRNRTSASEIMISRYLREDAEEVPFDTMALFVKTLGLDRKDTPYQDIKDAILKNKGKITMAEKSQLIALLLSVPTAE